VILHYREVVFQLVWCSFFGVLICRNVNQSAVRVLHYFGQSVFAVFYPLTFAIFKFRAPLDSVF